jgi:hypothetical protein
MIMLNACNNRRGESICNNDFVATAHRRNTIGLHSIFHRSHSPSIIGTGTHCADGTLWVTEKLCIQVCHRSSAYRTNTTVPHHEQSIVVATTVRCTIHVHDAHAHDPNDWFSSKVSHRRSRLGEYVQIMSSSFGVQGHQI